MLSASKDQVIFNVRWQSSLFLLIGVYTLFYFLKNTLNNYIAYALSLNSLLLVAIGTTGILATLDTKEKDLYKWLLSIYGTILAGVYAFTSFWAIILIALFPICDNTVDAQCNIEKQTSLALIALTVVLTFMEFLLGLLYINTKKNADEL